MSNKIGYDTQGPAYPPEWDTPEIILCASCGEKMDEAKLDNDEALCEACWERLHDQELSWEEKY